MKRDGNVVRRRISFGDGDGTHPVSCTMAAPAVASNVSVARCCESWRCLESIGVLALARDSVSIPIEVVNKREAAEPPLQVLHRAGYRFTADSSVAGKRLLSFSIQADDFFSFFTVKHTPVRRLCAAKNK